MINILEYINDYFAFPKHQILSDTRNMIRTIHKHLIKLKIFENSRDTDHWKKEIATYMMEIRQPKIKGNIKIKPAKYFELLFEHPIEPKEPYYDSYLWFGIRDLLDEYNNEYSKYSETYKTKVNTDLIDLLYNSIKIFMKTMSIYLSTRTLTREIITKELDKYIENIRDK